MKRNLFTLVFTILLSAGPLRMYAQQDWAMAVWEKGNEKPAVFQYHSVAETAGNGVEYQRIYDFGYIFRNEARNPIKLQYGYRWADRKLYIYDFESQVETLALDINLSEGERFTTFNGMEWTVEAVEDTLVNMSFCGWGECVSKKLLKVKTLDGTRSDQWLEDFGSLSNHFMISSMEGVEISQTLWVKYDFGEYIAREINADPFFAHDSGWLDGAYGDTPSGTYAKCTYENGRVAFESVQWWYEHRDYTCFYRDGDNIYKLYGWEMEPHVDSESALRKDEIAFNGLPIPASGSYTIHIDGNEWTTSASGTGQPVRGDIDGDGVVSIKDVMDIIDIILTGKE